MKKLALLITLVIILWVSCKKADLGSTDPKGKDYQCLFYKETGVWKEIKCIHKDDMTDAELAAFLQNYTGSTDRPANDCSECPAIKATLP